jgi:osmotically-inducible protein OsmY
MIIPNDQGRGLPLEGNVPDRRSKRVAEDIVESFSGVNVHNQLKLDRSQYQQDLQGQQDGRR